MLAIFLDALYNPTLFVGASVFAWGICLGVSVDFLSLAIFITHTRCRSIFWLCLLTISLIPSHIYTAKTDNPAQPLPILLSPGYNNNIQQ